MRAREDERTSLGSATFRSVIFFALLIMVGFGLIVPALPLFAKRFGVGEAGVGLVLTVFSAMRLVGDFITGGLIDRLGERTMTALGAAIVGVSSLAAGAAPNFGALVALRGVGGIGSAFFLGGLMAFLIGTVPAEERGRAMGIFQGAAGIGILVGPLLGGALIAFTSENVPLYVYGVVCLACAPLTARPMAQRVPSAALVEAPPFGESVPAPAERAWSKLKPLLRDRTYLAAIAASASTFYLSGAVQTLIPGLWTDVLHREKGTLGVPFALLALTSIVVVWHAGSLSDRRGRKFALIPALGVTALACVALGALQGAVAVLGLMAVLGLAGGYMRPGPTAMVADLAPADARGVAVSGYRVAGDTGALLGPIISGVVAQAIGFDWAFYSVAAVVALVFVSMLFARETAPARAV